MASKEEKQLKQFGKRLAQIRKSRGLTQQELAEAVGMSVVAIAYLETGKRWARLSTLLKLSVALRVKLEDLFKF